MANHICPLCGIHHWDRWRTCIVCRWFYGSGMILALLVAFSIISYFQLQ